MTEGTTRFVKACIFVLCAGAAQSAFAQMYPVPVPSENPITEPKRVLGKILFWDEQVSSDNTVSCATCHSPGKGGTEPRLVRSPGPDGQLNTADDIFGSGGVVKSDANYDYVQDAVFGIKPQQTGRSANPTINAAYFFDLFWDGRATSQFTDPQTGQVAIANGGALESQAVGPPVSSVEMAHPNWNWNDITAKLAQVRPLDLATSPQPDVAAALAAHSTYPELFAAAFGDPAITSKRVAFAIATYERTLVSDQTPWDAYIGGDTNAMTPTQVLGWEKFQTNGRCIECHMDPLFTDFTYRNIGARPIVEDTGRQAITGNPDHAGQFKVPGLRNTGLKRTYMHNGMFQNLGQVMAFYRQLPSAPPVFPENMDPLMNAIFLTSEESSAIQDFVGNALTDPRVANEQFPFDRLTLHIDRAADKASVLAGSGSPGTGGVVPAIIVQSPPMVGNDSFRVGLANALGNAQAVLGVSTTAPGRRAHHARHVPGHDVRRGQRHGDDAPAAAGLAVHGRHGAVCPVVRHRPQRRRRCRCIAGWAAPHLLRALGLPLRVRRHRLQQRRALPGCAGHRGLPDRLCRRCVRRTAARRHALQHRHRLQQRHALPGHDGHSVVHQRVRRWAVCVRGSDGVTEWRGVWDDAPLFTSRPSP